MNVRALGPGDDGAVAAAQHLFDGPSDPAATARFLADPDHHLLVAYNADDWPVGFVSGVEMTHPDKGTEMFLYELAVPEPARRRGTGRRHRPRWLLGVAETKASPVVEAETHRFRKRALDTREDRTSPAEPTFRPWGQRDRDSTSSADSRRHPRWLRKTVDPGRRISRPRLQRKPYQRYVACQADVLLHRWPGFRHTCFKSITAGTEPAAHSPTTPFIRSAGAAGETKTTRPTRSASATDADRDDVANTLRAVRLVSKRRFRLRTRGRRAQILAGVARYSVSVVVGPDNNEAPRRRLAGRFIPPPTTTRLRRRAG